jgi:HD-GYP domain-containing protein (c-di-GMP phosphodiesterase class II)
MAIRNVNGFQQAALLILHHHERLDGRGYPSRLRGTEIPLGSRIITVADSYDALTTDRPYRSARSRFEALAELQRCADTQFDAEANLPAWNCFKSMMPGGFSSHLRSTTGMS